MTFKEWETDNTIKVNKILKKLKGKTNEEITDYFNFDNMVKNEKDFCELYKTETKCHDMKDLNCFLCGCPFFKYSDNSPIKIENRIDVMSVCSINSKDSGVYTQDGKQQCDCSGCIIPHRKAFVKRHLELTDIENKANDAISTLDWIRGFQLSDIFGKWKLF